MERGGEIRGVDGGSYGDCPRYKILHKTSPIKIQFEPAKGRITSLLAGPLPPPYSPVCAANPALHRKDISFSRHVRPPPESLMGGPRKSFRKSGPQMAPV